MKKLIYLTFIIVFISGLFLVFKKNIHPLRLNNLDQQTTSIAKLIIDYGNNNNGNYEIKITTSSSAYSILEEILKKENIYYEVQQYDFGVFVKRIGDLESNSKKAWVYYVNEKSGDVAADKRVLNNNDVVTWKYEDVKY